MSTASIEVNEVSKRYEIGRRQTYKSLRESISDALSAPARFIRDRLAGRASEGSAETFWALRDVSFQIQQGEVVGIVGRNGAGKSTLLKVLSRITEPTTGRLVLHGRVASLLEVGTGFHPELSGRENIYLNGAILGMRRSDIRRRFDEIVAFAEVEKFIDTPVKRYSSGMYMRLAFSVAAHLEPEILLVDEVLAVGDASFQRKCLNKMESVGKLGRTVFFVSHNMQAVTRLCPRAIMLEDGRVREDGQTARVVTSYLRSGLGTSAAREWTDVTRAPGNDIVRLHAVRVRVESGETEEAIDIRRPISVEMDFQVLTGGHVLVPNFHFFNEDGTCLFVTVELSAEWKRKPRPVGTYRAAVHIPGNFLAEGTLVIAAAISTLDPVVIHVHELEAVAVQIVDSGGGDTARGDYVGQVPGSVRPLLTWTTTVVPLTSRQQVT
jgi:lipopolysaccharide transport system ATP-binding protein